MDCEYCGKVLKNIICLKAHYKTKACLKIQKEKNIKIEKQITFTCENCKKEFTTKYRLGEHINKCFQDLFLINKKLNVIEEENKDLKDKYEKIKKELEEENKDLKDKYEKIKKELENENKELKEDINSLKMQIYDVEIKHLNKNIDMLQEDHQAIIDIAKQPKSLVYNNNINKMLNIMQPLDFKNKDDMKQIIDEKYTLDDIFSGQQGFARFAYENLLKDEHGNLKYICSDPSRQIFKYKSPEGKIYKDIEAKKLTGFLVESGLKDKACNLTEQWLNNDNGDSYAHRFETVIDKAEEIRSISSDNSEFTKHLIPMTAI
jgi:hypothetical protein